MSKSSAQAKTSFGRETFKFLTELADHNDRAWFNANKYRYEDHVLAPSLAFIEAMAPRLDTISQNFVAIPKRMGGSLMRIYRDTRFAKTKVPYKTNIGIQFRHEVARDVHAPGFYVHIEPQQCFIGAGIWRPETEVLAAIRMEINEQPKLWRKASRSKRFTDHFELTGDRLKRPPKGFPADAAHIDDLKRKDFIATKPLTHRQVMANEFPDTVTSLFRRTAPLMEFLCGALDLRF